MEDKPVTATRMTADIEGDFVVFMTGMRIHKLWKIHKWWGNFKAMMAIMPVLFSKEEYGALGCHAWVSLRGPLLVAYFRSFEQLEHFANDKNAPHAAAWRDFFRRMGKKGDVGLWHETFVVRAGDYEAAYAFMHEPTGLGAASKWVPVSVKGDKAAQRRSAGARAAAAAAKARGEAAGNGGAALSGGNGPGADASGDGAGQPAAQASAATGSAAS